MAVKRRIYELPKVNMRNAEEVKERINLYFSIYEAADMKPTVVGLATALGTSRNTICAIVNGTQLGGPGTSKDRSKRTYANLPPEITDLVKKAYTFMEDMWEYYMTSGKINPASGIFLGKNNYGYRDVIENVVQTEQKQDTDYSAEEIRERYLGAQKVDRIPQKVVDSTASEVQKVRFTKLTEEAQKGIFEDYGSGMSKADLCRKYHTTRPTLLKLLHSRGVY